MSQTRYSNGIALCRKGTDGIVRLLMIHRRYTYAFFSFVCGRYSSRNDSAIIALLDEMTVDEKLDILSMNFSQMWYRIWLDHVGMPTMFARMRNKFTELIRADQGAKLRTLVRRSTLYASSPLWEIPKGRKKYPNEHNIDCAIREFYEETGIPRNDYRLTSGIFVMTFTEERTRYVITYYIAVSTRDISQRLGASSLTRLSELNGMRWVSAAEMPVYAPRDIAGHQRVIHFAKRRLKLAFTQSSHNYSLEYNTVDHA
jgi:8-oxo-dGTP pyrophosphatase MutT (NUDIX family)